MEATQISTNEWIDKMLSIFTLEYYSTLKRKKILKKNKKKEKNSKTCYNIDETGVHHNK